MELWLVLAVVSGLVMWFGIARMAARAWPSLGAGLTMLLVGGGLCWAIATTKTGNPLAGIIGILFGLLLFVAAGALVLGAVLRWFYELRHPPPGPPSRAPGWWGVAGIGLLCGLAVLLSALEETSSTLSASVAAPDHPPEESPDAPPDP